MAFTLIVDRRLQAVEFTTEQAAYDAGLAMEPMCCMSAMNDDDFTAAKWLWGYAEEDQDYERPMMVLEGRYAA